MPACVSKERRAGRNENIFSPLNIAIILNARGVKNWHLFLSAFAAAQWWAKKGAGNSIWEERFRCVYARVYRIIILSFNIVLHAKHTFLHTPVLNLTHSTQWECGLAFKFVSFEPEPKLSALLHQTNQLCWLLRRLAGIFDWGQSVKTPFFIFTSIELSSAAIVEIIAAPLTSWVKGVIIRFASIILLQKVIGMCWLIQI